MKRRSYLKAMLAAIGGGRGVRAQTAAKNPIVLYCDLSVDSSREQEMLRNFKRSSNRPRRSSPATWM